MPSFYFPLNDNKLFKVNEINEKNQLKKMIIKKSIKKKKGKTHQGKATELSFMRR